MYDEWVYHLDLCILAYQLHSQTLIWPMDPYYEQMSFGKDLSSKNKQRAKFMTEVRQTFQPTFTLDPRTQSPRFRGPATCVQSLGGADQGWPANSGLDPVISDYTRIDPWRPGFTRPRKDKEPWIVYDAPEAITNRIKEVYMVQYGPGRGPYLKPPTIETVPIKSASKGEDLLYCFEGGTGAIGDARDEKQYASWSMMGFVLAKQPDPKQRDYDVHIVFRGSRSGKLRPRESLQKETGNADWATDMDLLSVVEVPEVSQSGKVCRGFATSLKTMLPAIMECLDKIHKVKEERPPTNIYVTGHSLGGALASLFAAAVTEGGYRPEGPGSAMPGSLEAWPWDELKLLSFSAPMVGDKAFRKIMDGALRGRAKCIWLYKDPVTTDLKNRRIGERVRIPQMPDNKLGGGAAHEPLWVRRCLVSHQYPKEGKDAKEGTLTDVPAYQTGKCDDTKEPWRLPTTCRQTLEDLVRSMQAKNRKVEECFPGFVDLAGYYFAVLSATLAKNTAITAGIQNLLRAMRALDSKTPLTNASFRTLQSTWIKLSGPMIALDADLYKFIGLCLILAVVSTYGFATVDNIIAADAAGFKPLADIWTAAF